MDDLRLALFAGSSTDIVDVATVLAMTPADRALRGVDTRRACISLVAGGEERWGPQLSFGPLGPIVDQLGGAADRLADGELAVIRAGDAPVTELVVLEPDGDVTTASVVATSDPDVRLLTPGAGLTGFVAEHLGEMVELGQTIRGLAPVGVVAAAVVAALRREAALGRRAVEVLGRGDGSPDGQRATEEE